MSKIMVSSSEFDKNGETVSDLDDDILEIITVTADGVVEVGIDVSPKAERLYIRIPLHELVRLAMIEERESE